MSELEEKLGTILNNPQLMQQIMGMAQALGATQPVQSAENPSREPTSNPLNPPDMKAIQSLAGIARQNGIDANQQALLKALCPYISRSRVTKLERAMGAARMAGAASAFLNAGGLQLLTGR